MPRSTASGADVERPGHRRPGSGQALVELALIMPIMLLLLLAAADLARLFSAGVTISSAARAGALEAAQHPTSFQANQPCSILVNRVMCAVLTETQGSALALTPADVALTCDPNPCTEGLGSEVTVQVTGRFYLIMPVLAMFTGGQSINLASTSTAQIAVRPNIAQSTPLPTPTPTPTPTPSATGTPDPLATPTPTPDPFATPTPAPSPSPTPYCFPPVADFVLSPASGKKKRTDFQFSDLSSTTALCPLAWSWNFGDGAGAASTSTIQNPIHQYQAQGIYTVTLVVSNAGGSATRSREVTVTP